MPYKLGKGAYKYVGRPALKTGRAVEDVLDVLPDELSEELRPEEKDIEQMIYEGQYGRPPASEGMPERISDAAPPPRPPETLTPGEIQARMKSIQKTLQDFRIPRTTQGVLDNREMNNQ